MWGNMSPSSLSCALLAFGLALFCCTPRALADAPDPGTRFHLALETASIVMPFGHAREGAKWSSFGPGYGIGGRVGLGVKNWVFWSGVNLSMHGGNALGCKDGHKDCDAVMLQLPLLVEFALRDPRHGPFAAAGFGLFTRTVEHGPASEDGGAETYAHYYDDAVEPILMGGYRFAVKRACFDAATAFFRLSMGRWNRASTFDGEELEEGTIPSSQRRTHFAVSIGLALDNMW